MKKIEVIIRPEKLEALKKILTKNEYSGMTVLSAMGCGHQEGFDNPEFEKLGLEVNLLPKLYVMTVVWDEDLEDILSEIVDTLSTGNVGDGKVFISDIDDVMRIRTGERGKQVLENRYEERYRWHAKQQHAGPPPDCFRRYSQKEW